MAEDKQQTLTQLYSLRAGISAVASERNKVEEINNAKDNEIAELNKTLRDLNYEKTVLENRLSVNRENLNNNEKKVNNSDEKVKYYKTEYDKKLEEAKRKEKPIRFVFRLICTIISIFVAAYAIFNVMVYTDKLSGMVGGGLYWRDILYMSYFVVGFVLFICVCYPIPEGISYYHERIKKCGFEEAQKDYIYKVASEEKERNASLNIINRLSQEVANDSRSLTNCNQQISEIESRIFEMKSAAEQACKPHYQLGGMIQEQFENQFNSFLNLRDWKNVDIIIFAYESGRVETMKEALTYADEETRTDRIVNAVNASTQAVCRSIQSGLHSLALSMGQCFSVISRQIAEQTNKLERISTNLENLSLNTANLSASIAENTASNAESLANLAAKVDYANALQEQRNKSSNELVEKNEVFMLEARNVMHDIYTNRY